MLSLWRHILFVSVLIIHAINALPMDYDSVDFLPLTPSSTGSRGARFRVPLVRRAQSESQIPVLPQTTSVTTRHRDAERDREVEQQWQQIIHLYYELYFQDAIENLERLHGNVKENDRFHQHRPVTPFAFHYNRAIIQMALYRQTQHRSYLQYADLDFQSTIDECGHFYPAYIGRVEIAVYQRSWQRAYQLLREVLEILELQQQPPLDMILYDTHIYSAPVFISDIFADLSMITYRMGAQRQSDLYFQQAITVLRNAEEYAVETLSTTSGLQTAKRHFEHKRRDYNQQHNNHLPHEIIFYSKPTDLILVHGTKDVGIIRWRPMKDAILYTTTTATHKRSSSGLTARMVNQWHKSKTLKRLSREKKQQHNEQTAALTVAGTLPLLIPEPSPRLGLLPSVSDDAPSEKSSKKWRDRFKRLTKHKSKPKLRGG